MLYEWLDAPALTGRARFADHSRETFDAVLDLCEQIATDQFAPHNKKADQHEPHFDGEVVHTIPELKPALPSVVNPLFKPGATRCSSHGLTFAMRILGFTRDCKKSLIFGAPFAY